MRHPFERIVPLWFLLKSKCCTWRNAREKEIVQKPEPRAWVLVPPPPVRSEPVGPSCGFLMLWFSECKMKELDWRKPINHPVLVILWLKTLQYCFNQTQPFPPGNPQHFELVIKCPLLEGCPKTRTALSWVLHYSLLVWGIRENEVAVRNAGQPQPEH